MATLPQPLCGIVPPMPTPLLDRDTLDLAGVERLVEHVLAGGVRGLFVLGTTGEGPSLSYRLRADLVDRVCRQVGGRVPVLVGVTDTSPVESLRLAGQAADAGATAVVLAPPYYFPLSQPELLHYLRRVAPAIPLPVFLYNIPSHTKTAFGLEVVRRALAIDNCVGMKDSSGDMRYFHQLHRLRHQRPGWTLLIGPEELLAEAVLLGGDGGVCGGANLCPQLYVALCDAAARHDVPRAAELHQRVLDIGRSIYTVGRHPSAVIQGIKAALSCLGLCNDYLVEPLHRLAPAQRETIRQHLERLGIAQPST
jgi:dihydrodipicolinate synthase/N-acetylneuraminate lyase